MKQHPQDYDELVGIKQNGKYNYKFNTTIAAIRAAYADALIRRGIELGERYEFEIKPRYIKVHRRPYTAFCTASRFEIIGVCESSNISRLDNALFWLANPKKIKYAYNIFADVPKKLLNSKLCMDNKLRGMGKVMFDV